MSQTINFIDSVIRALPAPKERTVYWCNGCPGLGLRITPTGKKSFVYKYMSGRSSRWITIGKYPALTIRKARQEYDRLYELVHDYGKDPIQEEKDRIAKLAARIKVSEFTETYLEHSRIKEKTTIHEEERIFNKYLLPLVGDKTLDEVTGKDIDLIQSRIIAEASKRKNTTKGGRVAVKNYLAYIRQLFNLAIKKRLISSNPVTEIENLGTSGVRDRVLSFEEIWLFWNRLEGSGVPKVTANALKFMFVSMQRGIEVRNMKQASIKYGENIWQMEMCETKNRTMHRVPLNDLAHNLIEETLNYTGNSDYIFGATRAIKVPRTPFSDLQPLGSSALSQAIRKHRKQMGIEDFTPHDLRRTAATWITAVGLPKLYAKLMLNHSDGEKDITSEVYVQYSYDFEKRKAANVWEFVLSEIVNCKRREDIPTLDEMRVLVKNSDLL